MDTKPSSGPAQAAPLTRRALIGGLAAASGAPFAADPARAATAPLPPAVNACILTPQAVEGPFYFDPKLDRSDIAEDYDGVPLTLRLQVIEAGSCAPIEGARVDVWHANAVGEYSGYDRQGDGGKDTTRGLTFLRGTQHSDADGLLAFDTIYPGWYRGRTPHIHFKVFLDDARNVATGQIYFPDALSEFIYDNVAPYNSRASRRDTSNFTDTVLAESGGGHESFASVKEESDRYVAMLIIGIDRNATANAGPPVAARSSPGSGSSPGLPPGVSAAPIEKSDLVPSGRASP